MFKFAIFRLRFEVFRQKGENPIRRARLGSLSPWLKPWPPGARS